MVYDSMLDDITKDDIAMGDVVLTVGIDVGSVSAKAVLFDGSAYEYVIIPTGFSPKTAGEDALDMLMQQTGRSRSEIAMIIGTGYGRIHMPYADKTINELACHGRGAKFLFPEAYGVIDVGGQDSKVMIVDQNGKVIDFLLNDKCAAGTGRFLQVTAQALGVELDEIDRLTYNQTPVQIGSMCAVFAETEVLNLVVQGNSQGEILAGVLHSIAVRMTAMASKLIPDQRTDMEVVFTGGLAKSSQLCRMIENASKWKVRVPEQPQIIGALGAAVAAYEEKASK